MTSYKRINIEISNIPSSDVISTSDVTFDTGAGIWGGGRNVAETTGSSVIFSNLDTPLGPYEGT